MSDHDLAAQARALLDANRYLTLGTTDRHGHPWTTPVYFSAANEREYYWMSRTDTEHSRNLAARPSVSLVVFDSTVAPYRGRAVYAVGQARELAGDDVHRGLQTYPGPASRGVPEMTLDDVTGPSPYRLYSATATEVWVLCPRAPDQPCPLHGLAHDHRVRVA